MLCQVKTAVLLKFCSEGDNAGDAIQLAQYFNSWKCWLPEQVRCRAQYYRNFRIRSIMWSIRIHFDDGLPPISFICHVSSEWVVWWLGNKISVTRKLFNSVFLVITVPEDILALSSARTSAGTVLTGNLKLSSSFAGFLWSHDPFIDQWHHPKWPLHSHKNLVAFQVLTACFIWIFQWLKSPDDAKELDQLWFRQWLSAWWY